MSMTFDEATTKVENTVGDLNIPLGVEATLLDIIEILRDEYAPTVEMTKEDKQSLLDLKSRATFYYFNQSVKRWQQDRRGLQMPYGLLTEDELMQAWLHPDLIETIDN